MNSFVGEFIAIPDGKNVPPIEQIIDAYMDQGLIHLRTITDKNDEQYKTAVSGLPTQFSIKFVIVFIKYFHNFVE